ncbi:MAG: O-antigen ligase family protein [Acidobacteriia bacterium]|nr:O-antigen ligase family protein [Terriglobia bacterium]
MNSLKPMQWAGVVLGLSLALYIVYTHIQYFGNLTFLGGILLFEVVIACLWKYDQRFFVLLMIAFVWAGMHIPLQGSWTAARWIVLAAGALAGYVVWMKTPRGSFGLLHVIAFFCVLTAFVSATVSQYIQMSSLKAASLLLLFLYCSAGARLAVLGREDRFFHGLIWASEIAVYATAICYRGLGLNIWGNPNSLGGATSIGLFPILLWGWLTSEGPVVRMRRLVALLLCTYLVFFSMARAGMVSISLVTLIFCLCLRQYKLLVKAVALVLFLVAVTGMLAPGTLNKKVGDLEDTVLYKGHRQEGVLGSRLSPWQKSIDTIKKHPWFGTGYGTSPTGEDPGLDFGKISSSAETAREHGSSYMTITEWVGLFGVLPFIALLAVTLSNVWRVCAWMHRTADPRHYSIPLAMVVLSGFVHANFEDWLFAVGSYACVYFWVFSFLLADLVPSAVVVPVAGVASRAWRPSPVGFGAVAPNR